MITVNDNGIYRPYNEADLVEEAAFPDIVPDSVESPESRISALENQLGALSKSYKEGVQSI